MGSKKQLFFFFLNDDGRVLYMFKDYWKRFGAAEESRNKPKLPGSPVYSSNLQSFAEERNSETWMAEQNLVDPVL